MERSASPHKTCIMKESDIRPAPVRTYGKRELAMAYAPDISPESAVNRLNQWLHYDPRLYEALVQAGYRPRGRFFTSRQVEVIFRFLGPP